jgi:hypothetical protein
MGTVPAKTAFPGNRFSGMVATERATAGTPPRHGSGVVMRVSRRGRSGLRLACALALFFGMLAAATPSRALQPQNPTFAGTQTWPHFFEIHVAAYSPSNRIVIERLDKSAIYTSQPAVAAGDYLVRLDSTGVVRSLDGKLAFWKTTGSPANTIRFKVGGDTFTFTPGAVIPERGGSAPSGNAVLQQNPNDDPGQPKPHFYPENRPVAPIDFEVFIGKTCKANQFISVAPAWADLHVVSAPGTNPSVPLPGKTSQGFYRIRLNPDGNVAVLASTSPITFTKQSAGPDKGFHDLGVLIAHSCESGGDVGDILGFNHFPGRAAQTCNQAPYPRNTDAAVAANPALANLNDGFLCFQSWGGEFNPQGDAGYGTQPYNGQVSQGVMEFAGCNYIVMVPSSKPAEVAPSNDSVCKSTPDGPGPTNPPTTKKPPTPTTPRPTSPPTPPSLGPPQTTTTLVVAPPPPTGGGPTLTLNPSVGPTGFVTKATGTGFAPNTAVQLVWQPGLGAATVNTDAAGNFTKMMLIMPGDATGPRKLVAAVGGTGLVQDDFLVVLSPYQVASVGTEIQLFRG